MPLHPAYFQKLQELKALDSPPLREVPVEIIRTMFQTLHPVRTEIAIEHIEDATISTPAYEIPIRIYRPSNKPKLPVVVMYHGGGWVIGDLTTVDGQSREVCLGTGAIVVTVDYRLAPEHRFPAAVDDCFAALQWVEENIESYGGDPGRIALAGDSAGGNLAAVVALKSRDERGPQARCQLLVYPVIDGTRFDTSSYLENAEGFGLSVDDMKWFWEEYVDQGNRDNPYASPLMAETLEGLPPALVMTAEYDVLRDEGEAYGERLKLEGVASEVVRYDGYTHGFFSDTGTIPDTRKAMKDACDFLKRHLRD